MLAKLTGFFTSERTINRSLTQTRPFKWGLGITLLCVAVLAGCAIHPGARSWLLTTQWRVGKGFLILALPIALTSIGIPLLIFLKQRAFAKEEAFDIPLELDEATTTTLNPKTKKILWGIAIITLVGLLIGGIIAVNTVPVLQALMQHKMSVAFHLTIIGIPTYLLGAGFNLILLICHRCSQQKTIAVVNDYYDQSDRESSFEIE